MVYLISYLKLLYAISLSCGIWCMSITISPQISLMHCDYNNMIMVLIMAKMPIVNWYEIKFPHSLRFRYRQYAFCKLRRNAIDFERDAFSLLLYTPGQKFIEFLFNELSHQDNGAYQQFVNSGMETYHLSKKLWNIGCVGALPTVQCPKAMRNISNLRCPLTLGLPAIVVSAGLVFCEIKEWNDCGAAKRAVNLHQNEPKPTNQNWLTNQQQQKQK